jgi:plastocyanin
MRARRPSRELHLPPPRQLAAALVLVATTGLVLPAVPASADGAGPKHAVVAFLRDYTPSSISIKQGESVVFVDADPTAGPGHSFTQTVPEGVTPKFDSDIVPFGTFKEVPGISSLPAGTYSFHCKIHDVLKGTLTVG